MLCVTSDTPVESTKDLCAELANKLYCFEAISCIHSFQKWLQRGIFIDMLQK